MILVPFSIMWGAFAIAWEATVWWGVPLPAGWGFRLWGIPFVVIGLYMMVGRFIHDAWARGRTAYAVTTQRVLIVFSGWPRSVTSLPLATLSEITVQEKRDGTGTIVLGPATVGRRHPPSPRLEFIPHVRTVYETIRTAQAKR